MDIKNLFKRKDKPDSDKKFISEIYKLFDEYVSAYKAEWDRLDKNERLYIGDHWHDIPLNDPNEPRPVTPIIQSTIENIKADLMDNYPEAIITPEQPEFTEIATVLREIIQQNHDACDFKTEWNTLAHDLGVAGYLITETSYDTELNNGLGGARTRAVDPRGIMFDPLSVKDIQEGRGVFKFTPKPRKWMEKQYPDAHFEDDTLVDDSTREDEYVKRDTAKQLILIEYWWREYSQETGRFSVHMVKLAGRQILEDSRKTKPEGMYNHGRYPFVLRRLFPRRGSVLGLGYCDSFGNTQLYINKMDQIVMKNAMMTSHNKLLVTGSSGFDVNDLRDWSKEVHKGENLNGVTWFSTPPLPPYILNYIADMRNSIKEESGTNDFSRGTAGGGVTAASAIAALQEASSKRSRMAAAVMKEAYKETVRLEIEVEREYNALPRQVYYTENGEEKSATFRKELMFYTTELGNELPVEFMISIKVQKENQWTIVAHNELILQMVQLGVIQPAQAVELMIFEGKEDVLKKTAEGQQIPPELMAQQQMAQELQQIPTPDTIGGGV